MSFIIIKNRLTIIRFLKTQHYKHYYKAVSLYAYF